MDTTPAQPSYEVYVEVFDVTEWRDGCVYRTRSRGTAWLPQALVKANTDPAVIYAAASDEFARTHMTIRRAKPAA